MVQVFTCAKGKRKHGINSDKYGWLRRTEARVGITGLGWEQVVAVLLHLNGNVYSGCSMGNRL